MDEIIRVILAKKSELDRLRAQAPEGLDDFEHTQDIELTFTSNAIEGNTLTAVETTLVIEKGITVAGKPLKDHLEAVDHYDALRYVRELARASTPITEMDLRNLHRLVMLRSAQDIAGRYADRGRYVLTEAGRHAFPAPTAIPALMGDFSRWLLTAATGAATAFRAHRELVDIHPFNDGNGRTARLLMNLILLRAGYPPVAVRPADRAAYLAALQEAQAGGGAATFDLLLYRRLDETLDEMLAAIRDALPTGRPPGTLSSWRSRSP